MPKGKGRLSKKTAEEAKGKGVDPSSTQPPPPDYKEKDDKPPWKRSWPYGPFHKHHKEMDALEDIYLQLIETRKVIDQLLQESKEEKIRRRLELVPVQISDLMRGFQAAVARANESTRGGIEGEGEEASEDIGGMSIKDLEISLSAPIIEGGHAADPRVMLPNIKSVDEESARISLKFNIVSVPLK